MFILFSINDEIPLLLEKHGITSFNMAKQAKELCKLAVNKDGYTLQYVPDDKKTEELCKLSKIKKYI